MSEEIKTEESMPPDLAYEIGDILSVSMGNKPKSFSVAVDDSYKGNRSKFIENLEKDNTAFKVSNNKVYAVDISTEEGSKKYSEILDDVGNPEKQTKLESMDKPVTVIDPNSPVGFRSIVIIRTCEVETIKIKKKVKISQAGKEN